MCDTWCHLASTIIFYELVVRDQPKREREDFRGSEREREKSEKQQTLQFTQEKISSHENSLNVGKKISKILCGCTNPKNIMAPTDHCRTQNEHRNGRTDPR